MKKHLRLFSWLLVAAWLASLLDVSAQSDTWDGGAGDNLWGSGDNWSDNSAPGLNSIITFAGSNRLNPDWNYGDYNNMNQILFASGAGSFVLGSTDLRNMKLTANGGSGIKIENYSSNLQTINSTIPTIVFDTSGEINPVSGSLTINSAIVMDNGGQLRVYGNNGHTLTLNGNISAGSGSGHSFSINQNSVVELNAAMNFTGGNFINAGQLKIGTAGSVAGTIYVGDTSGSQNAQLRAVDGVNVNDSIVVRSGNSGTMSIGHSGSGASIYSGNISMQKGVTLTASSDATATFTGTFSGNQALSISGSGGNVFLSGGGVNDFSAVSVSSGFLWLDNYAGQAIDADMNLTGGSTYWNQGNQVADTVNIAIGGSAAMNLLSNEETVRSITMTSGSLTLGSAGILTLANQADATWLGNVSGGNSSKLTKIGDGTTLRLGGAGNSSFTGALYIDGGAVSLDKATAIGTAGRIYIGAEDGNGAYNSTLSIGVAGLSFGSAITVKAGSGTRTISNGAGSGTVTLSGNVTLQKDVILAAGADENLTMGGIISGVGMKVTKTEAGTVTLSGNSTYTGNTEIDQGTLVLSGDISNNSKVYLGNGTLNADATLELAGAGATIGDLQVNTTASGSPGRTINVTAGSHVLSGTIDLNYDATINANAGSLTLSGTVDLSNSGDNDLTINHSANVAISGAITANSGAAAINKQGSGTLTLSGNNGSSLFMLNINGGTVALNNSGALGQGYSDKVNFTGSGTLDVNANVGPANLGLRVASGQNGVLDVNNGNTFTVATLANIGGPGTFTKTGGGTIKITGDSSGTFGGGALYVNAGTITGSGDVGGDLIINSGAILAPGNSPGTLGAGNTTWNGGGTYLWEVNDVTGLAGSDPGWDLLDVNGTLTIGASSLDKFIIDVTSLGLDNLSGEASNFDMTSSYIWEIARTTEGVVGFDASDFSVSTADFLNPFSGIWFVSQQGNSVYLNYNYQQDDDDEDPPPATAVPEPNTLSFALLAGLLMVSLRYRMKHAANRRRVATA